MNKVAISVAILTATSSFIANADVISGSVQLTKNIEQECNIGLLAGNNDGSVGGAVDASELGSKYVHSELNNFNTGGQPITGKAKCNAAGGYTIHVTPTYGELVHEDGGNADQTVEYKLSQTGVADNITMTFGTDINPAGNPGAPLEVGTSDSTDVAKFQLLMEPVGNFTYAGQYTETLTFDLTPL